jgi:hypothetical protein
MHRDNEENESRYVSSFWSPAAPGPPARILVLLLAVLVAAVGPMSANQVKIGIQGGLSIPNLRGGGDNVYSKGFSSRKGPYFGLFADFALSQHFWLRTEVNYASQGGKRDGVQPIFIDLPGFQMPPGLILFGDFHNETILDYIEVPVLAEVSWGQRPRLFVNLGPYVGFLVRAVTKTHGESSIFIDEARTPLLLPPYYQPLPPLSFEASTDVKEDVHDVNAGIAGGIGVAFPAGPGEIQAAFHFSVGLTTIQRDVETSGKNNTGAVVLTIGYAHNLKGNR